MALAHLYVVQTRRDVNRQVPDLTVDMAMRLAAGGSAASAIELGGSRRSGGLLPGPQRAGGGIAQEDVVRKASRHRSARVRMCGGQRRVDIPLSPVAAFMSHRRDMSGLAEFPVWSRTRLRVARHGLPRFPRAFSGRGVG